MGVNSKVILLSRWAEYKKVVLEVIIIRQWESYGGQNIFFLHMYVIEKLVEDVGIKLVMFHSCCPFRLGNSR